MKLGDLAQLLNQGEYVFVQDRLLAYLDSHPRDADAFNLLGICYIQLGQKREAAESFLNAARLVPTAELWRNAGHAFDDAGNLEEAERAYRHALKVAPNDIESIKHLGRVLLKMGQTQDAAKLLSRGLRIKSSDQALLANLCAAYSQLDNPGGFVSLLGGGGILGVENVNLLNNLGVLKMRQEDYLAAEAYFHDLIKISPEFGTAWQNLAGIERLRGNLVSSLGYLSKALSAGAPVALDAVLLHAFFLADEDAKKIAATQPAYTGALLDTLLAPAGRALRQVFSDKKSSDADLLRVAESFRLAFPSNDGVACHGLAVMCAFLCDQGRLDSAELLARIFDPDAFISIVSDPRVPASEMSTVVVQTLRFMLSSEITWNRVIFERYILSGIRYFFDHDKIDSAFHLGLLCYGMVQNPATSENHRYFVNAVAPLFTKAGELHAKGLDVRSVSRTPGSPMRIGVIIDHPAHEEAPDAVLLSVLTGWRNLSDSSVSFHVYAFSGASKHFSEKLDKLSVPLWDGRHKKMSNLSENLADRVEALHRQMDADRIDLALFFNTLDPFTLFAAPLRLAPLQVFYSMQFYNLNSPYIDGYMTALGLEGKTIRVGNKDWLSAVGAYKPLDSPFNTAEQKKQAKAIRHKLGAPKRILLGSIARSVKLGEPFLLAVKDILQRHPEATFLWAGQIEDSVIQNRLAQLEISDRCQYVGYVDPVVYAQVLDVHLDPFPFPGGLTMRETWHQGGAYVCMDDPYESESGQQVVCHSVAGVYASPLLTGDGPPEFCDKTRAIFLKSGKSLLMAAKSVQEYVDFASALISSHRLRADVGNAAKSFSRSFLTNHDLCAQSHISCLQEIFELSRQA